MKKVIRIIAVAVIIAMLGVLLCSCTYLDEKKANHAIYCDDSKSSFEFRGYTYKKIKITSSLTYIKELNDGTDSFVTTEDVPVLLANSFGDSMHYSLLEKNPIIIKVEHKDHSFSRDIFNTYHYLAMTYNESDDLDSVFVREDKYDDVSKLFESAKLDHYYIKLINYYETRYDDYEYDSYPVYVYDNQLISDEATDAIVDAINKGERINYTKMPTVSSWDTLRFDQCDKDLMLTNNSSVYIFSNGQDYYLVQTVADRTYGTDVIKVPEKYKELFRELYTKYRECVYSGVLEDYYDDQSTFSVNDSDETVQLRVMEVAD